MKIKASFDSNKPKRVLISKVNGQFVVDSPDRSGSPPQGRGRTMDIALGQYLRANQDWLGVVLETDASSEPAEMRRRERELAKR